MKRQTFNLDQFNNKNLIWRRLLEVATYDLLDKIVGVSIKNDNDITKLLSVFLNGKMLAVEEIRQWLYLETSKPTKFELALIYDKFKAPVVYIKNTLKLANTNVNAFDTNKMVVKPSVLSVGTLQTIQNWLLSTKWSILDFQILKYVEL